MAGAVVRRTAGSQGPAGPLVRANQHSTVSRSVSGRTARIGAAQNGVDARRSSRRQGAVAPAIRARPSSVGCRRAPRLSHIARDVLTAKGCGARVRACGFGGTGHRAGPRRDRFFEAGQSVVRGQPHYTGSAGKITNCQIGVFAAYVCSKGHALIDRQLYLAKDWTKNRERLTKAHVPEGVRFATKPSLAVSIMRRAIETEVPFAWVAADTVYGVGEVEMALRRAGKGYVLGVPATQPFN